ncbi:alkylhydroperoxidase/carboxymuconolactone decarboxylase family protein YurZ [Bradyrhizobium sp. LB1.3]|uniref:hypothetical protein n=1 Tax=Bradyrhizobium sp. LB14.3 TaxID=3156328 RepID=UPI0033916069
MTVASEALVKPGATRQEVEETHGVAIYMGGGPSLMYAAESRRRRSHAGRSPNFVED